MRYILFSILLLLGYISSAPAQPVNVVPQVGLTWGYAPKATYSAAFVGLVPAASATDVACIAGSASKTITLTKVELSGTAGTLVTLPVSLVRRAAADSGGTSAGTTANPANTITKHNAGNSAATATLIAYTANPTINDSAGTRFATKSLTLPTTTAGTVYVPAVFDFGQAQSLQQGIVLRGAAQQVCINLNGVSVSSGVLNGSFTWTEE